jgi:hypothetical protein
VATRDPSAPPKRSTHRQPDLIILVGGAGTLPERSDAATCATTCMFTPRQGPFDSQPSWLSDLRATKGHGTCRWGAFQVLTNRLFKDYGCFKQARSVPSESE